MRFVALLFFPFVFFLGLELNFFFRRERREQDMFADATACFLLPSGRKKKTVQGCFSSEVVNLNCRVAASVWQRL